MDLQARPAKRVAAVYLVCHTASIWHVCSSCPLCERLRGTREEAVESMMRVHYNSILTVQLVLTLLYLSERASKWMLVRLMFIGNGVVRIATALMLHRLFPSPELADRQALYPPGFDFSAAIVFGAWMVTFGLVVVAPRSRSGLNYCMLWLAAAFRLCSARRVGADGLAAQPRAERWGGGAREGIPATVRSATPILPSRFGRKSWLEGEDELPTQRSRRSSRTRLRPGPRGEADPLRD